MQIRLRSIYISAISIIQNTFQPKIGSRYNCNTSDTKQKPCFHSSVLRYKSLSSGKRSQSKGVANSPKTPFSQFLSYLKKNWHFYLVSLIGILILEHKSKLETLSRENYYLQKELERNAQSIKEVEVRNKKLEDEVIQMKLQIMELKYILQNKEEDNKK